MITIAELVPDDLPDALNAFKTLIPQLSSSAGEVTHAQLFDMITSDSSHVLVARTEDGTIVGSLTLVAFRIPTGVRAWIEDVVVDEAVRGQGVGEQLNRAALALAEQVGARTVDLTSRPSRVAANNLYKKIGFVERETNVYRYSAG